VVVAVLLLWGVVGWSFPSIQQTRLVGIDARLAPVTLSLNASATYLGISLGAVLGSMAVSHGRVLAIGWLAAGCELLGLAVLRLLPYRAQARPEAPVAGARFRAPDVG